MAAFAYALTIGVEGLGWTMSNPTCNGKFGITC